MGSQELRGHIGQMLLAFVVLVQLLLGTAQAQDQPQIGIVPQAPHGLGVTSLAFSSDNVHVLSGSDDSTVKLWDAPAGRLLRTFEGHAGPVYSVAFAPSGTRVVSGGRDTTVKLWDATTGGLLFSFVGHSDRVNSVAFSPDGARLLSGSSDKTMKLWDVAKGQVVRTFRGHSNAVNSVAFSPDGTRLLSGSSDKTVKLWDAATGELQQTLMGHSAGVNSVAYSSDGTRVVSGSSDTTMKLWNVATGGLLHTLEGHSGVVASVAFMPDGTRLLSGSSDKTVRQWDAATGGLLLTFGGHSDRVTSIAVSPDGLLLIVAGSIRSMQLWDANAGGHPRTFGDGSGVVSSVAFSPDGTRLLSGSADKTMKLWDATTGGLLHTFEGHSSWINSVAFSRDGTRVLSGSDDKTLKLWDAVTRRLVRTLEGHSSAVYSVAFAPDGRRLLSGSRDKTVKLWNAETGREERTFQGHAGEVRSVAFSPDGARILTGSSDKTLKLWDAATGQLVRTFAGHADAINSVAFSPDGTRIASASMDTTAKLWDVATGAVLRSFEAHSSRVHDVAFSPDGAWLLTGSYDKTIKLWDVATGRPLRSFIGHLSAVNSIVFSPDARRILSGGGDASTMLWDSAGGNLLTRIMATPDGEWLAITQAGFFAGSDKGTERTLSVVRGFEVFSVEQFYQHLYRPDLVEEALKGDPEGKLKDAASKLNLEKIVDSGPAPQIEHLQDRTERAANTVRITVRLTDTGGGIGSRIVWRVNGKTSGNLTPDELVGAGTPSAGRALILTETFRVDPGQLNVVEITAHNGTGLIATPTLRILVDKFGATTQERPRMHVLAIGVNKYRMQDYELRLAVKDATDFAKALEVVGSGLFAKVQVETLVDEQVTQANIAAAFARIGADAKPWDVFVLFLGGHGRTIAGHYYYYPQTLDFAAGQAVEAYGLGQDQWQAWLAKIDAQKKLLILDTCESGAAAALVRGADSSRQTAMDQLQYATGEDLIAASRQAAYEGYQGHGVLTYALLEAFNKTDTSGDDDRIRVGSLADYVDERVPVITQQLFGIYQRPIRKLSGNDFPIGMRAAVLAREAGAPLIPKTPTHVLIRPELVRERPSADAPGERQLSPGMQVRVVEFTTNAWAIVAREGEKLGYVQAAALAPLQ
jgi:WD40 repeat protein